MDELIDKINIKNINENHYQSSLSPINEEK